MLEVANISPVQGSAPRPPSRDAVVAAAATEVAQKSKGFVSSTIRVDNLQNVAILEYRSENGEVVQQYPTQSQIQAFRRAEHLQKVREEARAAEARAAAAPDAAKNLADTTDGDAANSTQSILT